MMNKIELNDYLASPDLINEIGIISYDEVVALFGFQIARMYKFDQKNPHHCYDLFEHTMHTVDSINKSGLDETTKGELRIAALFHDIGKPNVAFMKGETQHFYGHAVKSAEIAYPILLELGYSESESKRLCFFIKHHDDFIGFRPEDEFKGNLTPYNQPTNVKTVKALIECKIEEAKELDEYVPSIEDYSILMHLCFADASAQSEITIQNGEVVDGRQRKIDRLKNVADCINYIEE